MEAWREHLAVSIARQNGGVKKAANKIFKVLEGTISNTECDRCLLKCYEADVLQLECSHVLCFDCVGDQLERLVGFFERNQSGLSEQCSGVLGLLLICSTCHRLLVLKRRSDFHVKLQSKDRGWLSRETFEVDAAASAIVEGQYTVWMRYDNERRAPLGHFTAKSLWPWERPAHTKATLRKDDEGTEPFDYAGLSDMLTRENSLWLEDWKHDKTLGNPQGWQYAFNWPSPLNRLQWHLEPSVLGTFVRRRRMLRVSIRLSALLAVHRYVTSGGGGPVATIDDAHASLLATADGSDEAVD